MPADKVVPIESANIDWFVFGPTRADPPFCTVAELSDGTYDLDDLLDFHEVMAEQGEYHRRMAAAAKAESEAPRGRARGRGRR